MLGGIKQQLPPIRDAGCLAASLRGHVCSRVPPSPGQDTGQSRGCCREEKAKLSLERSICHYRARRPPRGRPGIRPGRLWTLHPWKPKSRLDKPSLRPGQTEAPSPRWVQRGNGLIYQTRRRDQDGSSGMLLPRAGLGPDAPSRGLCWPRAAAILRRDVTGKPRG